MSADPVTSRRRGALLAAALVPVFLAIAVYTPAVDNPFVYDDRVTVLENPSIRDLGNWKAVLLGARFRPLTNLSYAVDYAIWGDVPTGYHWTSIALHALNVYLLYMLFASFDRRPGAPPLDAQRSVAFVAASLFAVHPLLTEAVGYVSGRSELLSTGFVLGALLALRSGVERPSHRHVAFGIALAICGMASKESAAMLPLLFLAYDRWLLPGDATARRRRLYRLHLPAVALIGLLAVARIAFFVLVEAQAAPRSPWQNLLTELGVIWRYVGLSIVPVGQSLVHGVAVVQRPTDGVALLHGAALLATVWIAVRIADRHPATSLGLVWFLAFLAPSSSVLPLLELMAEHRVYLASAGLFLLAGLGWRWLAAHSSRAVAFGGLAAALLTLSLATGHRLHVWSHPVMLWTEAARRAPDEWVSQYGLGDAYRRHGACEDAIVPFLRAIELRPEEMRAYVNLGACLAEEQRFADAETVLRRGLLIAPDTVTVRNNLAAVLSLRGATGEALELYHGTLERAPTNLTALKGLAALHETRTGDRDEAIRTWREVRRLAPDDGVALEQLRRLTTGD